MGFHHRREKDSAPPHWDVLVQQAESEVEAVLRSLPSPIREELRRVAIVLERVPSPSLEAEGADPSLLGWFEGDTVRESGTQLEPPRILLFLENLWEESGGHLQRYRREVRRTLLHEIGHYLGWSEEDLEARALD